MDRDTQNSTKELKSTSTTRGNILIVDDEVFIRNAFQMYFETLGFNVHVADSRKSAKSIFGNPDTPLDVVILDLVMPGVRGLELLQALRSHRPDVEVIIATGCGSLSSAIEAMRKGAFDYITKPIVNFEEELLKVVEDALLYRRNKLKNESLATLKKGFQGQSEFAFHNLALFEKFVTFADIAALWRVRGTSKEEDPAKTSKNILEKVKSFFKKELGISSGLVFLRKSHGNFSPAYSWGKIMPVAFKADWFSNHELFNAVMDAKVFVFSTEDLNAELLGFDPRKLEQNPMAIHLPLILEGKHRGTLFLFFTKRAEELKYTDFLDNGHPYVLLTPMLSSLFLGAIKNL